MAPYCDGTVLSHPYSEYSVTKLLVTGLQQTSWVHIKSKETQVETLVLESVTTESGFYIIVFLIFLFFFSDVP